MLAPQVTASARPARPRRAKKGPAIVRGVGLPLGLPFRILASSALLCAALFVPSAARALDPAQSALRDLLESPAVRGARVGVLVEDLSSGARLIEHEPDVPRIPASNQKLVTATAALEAFGPTHRFETPLLYEGELVDGVIRGTLWVVGSGDPSLVSESLWQAGEALRLLGVRGIRDGIAVDNTWMGDGAHHPDWTPVSRRAYHAPTAAFAVNYSSFRVDAVPDPEPGGPGVLRLAPDCDYFRGRSRAISVAGASRVQLGLEPLSDGTGEVVTLAGSLSAGSPTDTYWRSVALPGRYAASVLRAQLEAHGVRVGGGVRVGRLPEDAAPLHVIRGRPLAEVVTLLNKYSNNFVAEQLTKSLGARSSAGPATWEAGVAALRQHLKRHGVFSPGTVIADGSGLSARNRISPAALVALLRAAAREPRWGAELWASLPLGGLDGTLEDRMPGMETVRAKTGHLRRVAALSGVAVGPQGERRLFSVLVNGARGGRIGVDAALDAFVERVADLPGSGEPELAAQSSAAERR